MVGAIQSAIEKSPELADIPLTITTRLGYRTLDEGDDAQKNIPGAGDVVVEEEGEEEEGEAPSKIMHNMSSEYIRESVQSSPLLELQQDMKNLKLVYLLQNPEVQVLELLKDKPNAKQEERLNFIRDRWTPALATLQEYSKSHQGSGSISFGVVSNGLGIPPENNHPMYLDVETVISAAENYDRFSTIQVPANLLEKQGWNMAREIRQTVPHVAITAMRPLTCYPDLGTGTGHPFRLVDYALPTLEEDGEQKVAPIGSDDDIPNPHRTNATKYTYQMSGVPAIYQIALQAAMSHFDAEELLEIKQERDLNVEERETLDGFKLVQSMIHDLDAELEKVRSFSAHEEELYGRIIPLLYDTFEAMDDRTSDVLQAYFAAYAVAVRYSIAKKTRQVLRKGESSSSPTYPDIPSTMALQEYALRKMLADSTFDRLIVGASTLQDFRHQTDLIEMISEDKDPLEAINKANDAVTKEKKKQEEKKQEEKENGEQEKEVENKEGEESSKDKK